MSVNQTEATFDVLLQNNTTGRVINSYSGKTSSNYKDGSSRLLHKQVSLGTRAQSNDDDENKFLNYDLSQTKKSQNEINERLKSISGTIMHIDRDTVLCEVQLADRDIEIHLPMSSFSWDINVGTNVSITLSERSGLKRMEVEKLDFVPQLDNNELDLLIDEL